MKSKNETTKMWGIFIVTTSSNVSVEQIVVDHKNENLDAQKEKLLALIVNSTQHSNSEDKNILYLRSKDGEVSAIDFRLPMSANPIYSSSKDGEVRSFSYEGSGYNLIAPLPINKSLAEALSKEKYELEECNENIYTQVKSKDLKLGEHVIGKVFESQTVSSGISK